MSDMIAPCGLDCAACPIRLATLEPDAGKQRAMRESVAMKLSGVYKRDFSADKVTDCDGCRAGGRLFNGCADCGIRLCAAERELENCAYCEEYCCGKLDRHYKYDPESKERIEKLRDALK